MIERFNRGGVYIRTQGTIPDPTSFGWFNHYRYELCDGYRPAPVDQSGISLTPAQEALVEGLARNEHNVWAKERIKQGWSYATQLVELQHLYINSVERIMSFIRHNCYEDSKPHFIKIWHWTGVSMCIWVSTHTALLKAVSCGSTLLMYSYGRR